MSENVAKVPKVKKAASTQQLENLRKGFAALQAKRKALTEKEESPVTLEPTPVAPPPVPEPEPPAPAPTPAPVPKIKKERKPKAPAFDQTAFRDSLIADLRVERVVDRPVDRIIEKETVVYKDRVVSGSELLNRIYGFA
jgi:hypothetical protein